MTETHDPGSIRERLLVLLEKVASAPDDFMLSEVKVDIPAGRYPRQYLQPAAESLLKELREAAALSPPPTRAEERREVIRDGTGGGNTPDVATASTNEKD